MPAGATSGYITVTSRNGTGLSPTQFTVETGNAKITSFSPKTGQKLLQVTIYADSPVGSADPSLNLTSMQFSGLGNIAQGGTPTFQNNDTVVILPAVVSNISVSGSFDMNQPCCTPALFWCVSCSRAMALRPSA